MSAPITIVVQVNISQQGVNVTQATLSKVLIVGPSAVFSEKYRTYASVDEMTEADFGNTDPEVYAATRIFAQNPKLAEVKVGRQEAAVAMVQELTFSAALITGNTINGKIGGVALTATAFNTSNAQTLTDLATKIAASDLVATAVSDGVDTITITAQTAGIPDAATEFVVTGGASQATATVTTTTENHGFVEDIQEITEATNDWYGLIITERNPVIVEMVSDYIETTRKIFMTLSEDDDILDAAETTDIASILAAKNYRRTGGIYNKTANGFADAGVFGRWFPKEPGSITMRFKTIQGIVADDLTTSQRNAAFAKNWNIYINVGGVDGVHEGVTVDGAPYFLDITRDTDWIGFRMEERVYALLAEMDKIPYTDDGKSLIEKEIRGTLQEAEDRGIITANPRFIITSTPVNQVTVADRKNRIYTKFNWSAQYAGAIHQVIPINGILTF